MRAKKKASGAPRRLYTRIDSSSASRSLVQNLMNTCKATTESNERTNDRPSFRGFVLAQSVQLASITDVARSQ